MPHRRPFETRPSISAAPMASRRRRQKRRTSSPPRWMRRGMIVCAIRGRSPYLGTNQDRRSIRPPPIESSPSPPPSRRRTRRCRPRRGMQWTEEDPSRYGNATSPGCGIRTRPPTRSGPRRPRRGGAGRVSSKSDGRTGPATLSVPLAILFPRCCRRRAPPGWSWATWTRSFPPSIPPPLVPTLGTFRSVSCTAPGRVGSPRRPIPALRSTPRRGASRGEGATPRGKEGERQRGL
mmetsp:Transcript_7855/g.23164  ORF Transcript_7855/g.23164 Transcript_7855/m.23164 type:complete len:235 (-) Transcript_7855:1220-1924(-)